MARFLSIIIVLSAVGGGIYYLFSMESKEDIFVTDKLQISQQYGNYVPVSNVNETTYYAIVEGKIRNNLDKPIKNVFIKYEIAGQETSATVFDLAPGQEIRFNTRGISTTVSNPEYDFVGLYYD